MPQQSQSISSSTRITATGDLITTPTSTETEGETEAETETTTTTTATDSSTHDNGKRALVSSQDDNVQFAVKHDNNEKHAGTKKIVDEDEEFERTKTSNNNNNNNNNNPLRKNKQQQTTKQQQQFQDKEADPKNTAIISGNSGHSTTKKSPTGRSSTTTTNPEITLNNNSNHSKKNNRTIMISPKNFKDIVRVKTTKRGTSTGTGATSNSASGGSGKGGAASGNKSCDGHSSSNNKKGDKINIAALSPSVGVIHSQSLLAMMQDSYNENYLLQQHLQLQQRQQLQQLQTIQQNCEDKKNQNSNIITTATTTPTTTGKRRQQQDRRGRGLPDEVADDEDNGTYKNEYDEHDELMLAAANAALNDTSWGEVCRSCFVHSPKSWFIIIGYWILVLACLYFFGLGLEFLGSGAKVMTGCVAGELFGISSHSPMGGVAIGILSTVLLQSSSTTTSIIVGLVGANDSVFTVSHGIYMIMGANIGTTITNTIVALLQFQNQHQLANAFAGATVHDIFNFLTVLVLLPLEASTGYLNHLTEALVRGSDTENGDSWEGPVKKLITPIADKILIANKGLTNAVAGGGSNCNDFYPVLCEDEDNPTYTTCERFGLIACSKHNDHCPLFFDPNADVIEDKSAGLVVLCMGLFLIFVSLYGLVYIMTRLLTGVSLRIIHKATSLNGYILIFVGTCVTFFLQSSSTTTSFLTPMVGIGALRLEQMYPLTIGANVGTTVTAVFAAMVTDGDAALQVALAHLMFNITGMLIWYPILSLRRIPVIFARRLGQYTRVWRPFTLLYLFGAFIILPLVCLGISALFHHQQDDSHTWKIIGAIITSLLVLLLVFWMRWCYFSGGRAKAYKYMSHQHNRYTTLLTITTDMEHVKDRIDFHEEYAGIGQEPPTNIVTRTTPPPSSSEGEGEQIEEAKNLQEESTTSAKKNKEKNPRDTKVDASTTSCVRDHKMEDENKTKKKACPSSKKAVREALQTISYDMEYLKAGLAILSHHTGIPDYSDNDDDDDNHDHDDDSDSSSDSVPEASSKGISSKGFSNEDDSDDDDIEASNCRTNSNRKSSSLKRKKKSFVKRNDQTEIRSVQQFSIVTSRSTFVSVFFVIPKIYIGSFLLFVALVVWGIIALFDHGGKASIVAAYFLIVICSIAMLFTVIFWDTRSIKSYFRNMDRQKRQETINALPTDVKLLKKRLRGLLLHYKLNVDNILPCGSLSVSAETTTEDSPH